MSNKIIEWTSLVGKHCRGRVEFGLPCNVATSNVVYQDVWYLDVGCSNHMSGKKELFSHLDESVWGKVNFGNKSKVLIMGKGNVKICSKVGIDVTIVNVFFVPNLFGNLLSMGQLTETWHIINIFNGVCTLSDKNKKMIAKVHMTKNMMFPMFLQPKTLFSLKAIVEYSNWLWHFQFDHLNFRGLKLLE